MATTPRGSLPMYFPAKTFVLADVVNCSTLVDLAYDQYAQWQNQRFPSRQNFKWKKPANGYNYSGPFYWTYTWWDGISYDEPFGFLATDANQDAYLVFRGTMGKADEEQDVKMDQTPYNLVSGYGQVHAGFFEIYNKLRPDVHSAIGALSVGSIKRFFFTGHSLGCGLSSLAVPDVITNTAIKPGSFPLIHYNLASPRVGDPQFAYSMNNNGVPTFRIVNTEDIVPDGPTAILFSYLYKHIGTAVDFTAQYNTIGHNHALDVAYDYAVRNPNDPEGPLPPPPAPGLASRPGVELIVEKAQMIRLLRPVQGAETPRK
jgi:triacylglycerol lipase